MNFNKLELENTFSQKLARMEEDNEVTTPLEGVNYFYTKGKITYNEFTGTMSQQMFSIPKYRDGLCELTDSIRYNFLNDKFVYNLSPADGNIILDNKDIRILDELSVLGELWYFTQLDEIYHYRDHLPEGRAIRKLYPEFRLKEIFQKYLDAYNPIVESDMKQWIKKNMGVNLDYLYSNPQQNEKVIVSAESTYRMLKSESETINHEAQHQVVPDILEEAVRCNILDEDGLSVFFTSSASIRNRLRLGGEILDPWYEY